MSFVLVSQADCFCCSCLKSRLVLCRCHDTICLLASSTSSRLFPDLSFPGLRIHFRHYRRYFDIDIWHLKTLWISNSSTCWPACLGWTWAETIFGSPILALDSRTSVIVLNMAEAKFTCLVKNNDFIGQKSTKKWKDKVKGRGRGTHRDITILLATLSKYFSVCQNIFALAFCLCPFLVGKEVFSCVLAITLSLSLVSSLLQTRRWHPRVQSPKNLGGRVALPSGKFLRVRKVFARNP